MSDLYFGFLNYSDLQFGFLNFGFLLSCLGPISSPTRYAPKQFAAHQCWLLVALFQFATSAFLALGSDFSRKIYRVGRASFLCRGPWLQVGCRWSIHWERLLWHSIWRTWPAWKVFGFPPKSFAVGCPGEGWLARKASNKLFAESWLRCAGTSRCRTSSGRGNDPLETFSPAMPCSWRKLSQERRSQIHLANTFCNLDKYI